MIKEQNGMTLIEILVAVMILGVLAASFSTVFSSSVNAIDSSGNRYEALTEAQGLLERALQNSALGEKDGIFRKETMQKVAGVDVPGMLITAQVSYTTALGEERSVELSVFQAQSGEVNP